MTFVAAVGVPFGLIGLAFGAYWYRRFLSATVDANRCAALRRLSLRYFHGGVPIRGSEYEKVVRCTYHRDHSGPHRGVYPNDNEVFWAQEIDLEKIDKQIEHLLPKGK